MQVPQFRDPPTRFEYQTKHFCHKIRKLILHATQCVDGDRALDVAATSIAYKLELRRIRGSPHSGALLPEHQQFTEFYSGSRTLEIPETKPGTLDQQGHCHASTLEWDLLKPICFRHLRVTAIASDSYVDTQISGLEYSTVPCDRMKKEVIHAESVDYM